LIQVDKILREIIVLMNQFVINCKAFVNIQRIA